MSTDTPPRLSIALLRRPAPLLLALVAFAGWLALTSDPIDGATQHRHRMWLSVVAVGLVLAAIVVRTRPSSVAAVQRGRRFALSLALGCACLFGIFNYFNFESRRFTGISAHADVTYYYLNSKYFDELGYYELYPAMLVADREHRGRLDHIREFRDLHSYRNVPVNDAFSRADEVRAQFSGERWQAFQHDLDYFLRHGSRGSWDYFLKDHGYNAPPTWTVVGQRFSSITPVELIPLITQIDVLVLGAAFVAVGMTFGGQALGFCFLFYVCTASGKWPMIGSSLLRFDWLAALMGAVCAFRTNRFALAGGLLSYAACNRIFPAIFVLPWLADAGARWIRTRKLESRDRQVIAGAVVVVTLLVGGALITQGPAAFASAAENLLLHNSAKSYSSYRVGLGDAFLFHGERSRAEIIGGIPAKEAELAALKPTLHAIGLACIALVAAYVVVCRPTLDRALALGFFPFFVLTTPQINYFNVRVLLILWHARHLTHPRHAFGLALLFAIEAMAARTKVGGAIEYTWTSMTSVGLTLYAAVMLGGLARDIVRRRSDDASSMDDVDDAAPKRATAPAVMACITAAVLATTVFAAYWRRDPVPPPAKRMGLADLSTVQQDGDAWNGPGTIRLEPTGIEVKLGGEHRSETIDISFDNNDQYAVTYFLGEREVGRQAITRSNDNATTGLARRKVKVTAGARKAGFDRVTIVPRGGDGLYSVGHVVFGDG